MPISKRLGTLVAAVALIAAGVFALPRSAEAYWAWRSGVRIWIPAPVYVVPPPVVVYAPPRRVYAPPVVYAAPPPVVVVPRRVWVPGYWRGPVWIRGYWR
jgi:hypothetical protein